MKKRLITISLLIFSTIQFSLHAESERHIHINGEHLETNNIRLLDQIVGNTVGDGYYWLNMQTGAWGYENNEQVQGVISNIANQVNQQTYHSEAQVNSKNQNKFSQEANRYNNWEGVDQNGGVVSGRVNGKNCTYVSVAGMTMKDCD